MKLNKRKGFTIVELVIVIAVIAILAAVLIPNISNLVKKANASADESLVRNLNTALSMDVEKHQTMDAALEAAKTNGGYDLTTIVTKNKDNKILWDSKNDCFVYMKKGASKPTYLPNTQEVKDVNDVDYFEILNEMPTDMTNQKYSIYLAGESYDKAVEVTVGFDAGKNAGIPTVTYKRDANATAQDVIVRTNGGNFTVEAKADVVRHYGAANKTEIKAVALDSYHENGASVYVSIEEGHFYAEKDAKVFNLTINKNGVKITVDSAAKVVAYSKKDGSVTEITVNGTKLAEEEIKKAPSGDIADVVADNGVAEIDGIQFATLQAAFAAAYDGATIVLNKDVILTSTAVLKNGVKVTLNANGKTVSNVTDIWNDNDWSLISVQKKSNLVIDGSGSFLAKDNDCYAVDVQDGSTCTIENGEFKGNIHAVYVLEGFLTVNGGSFRVVQTYPDAAKEYGFVLNCYDANRANGTATVKVAGGEFVKFNPSNCWAEGKDTNFLMDGYSVEEIAVKEEGKDTVLYYIYKVVKSK